MRQGSSDVSGKHEWVENSEHFSAEASHSEEIARIMREADDITVVSSPVLTHDFTRDVEWSGARCYVMTSTEKRLLLESQGMLDKETFRLHEKTTSAISKTALVRHSDDLGARAILADPESGDCRGLFLTSDLTVKSMICGQFLAVPLSPAEIREMWAIMRWTFWERATSETVGKTTKRWTPLGKFKLPKPARVLQSKSRSRGVDGWYMDVADSAASEILVASTELDKNNAIVRRLCELGRKGTSVTVMTDTSCSMRTCSMMNAANIRVLGFSCFHASAITSESGVLVASAGMGGSRHGTRFEIGVFLDDERAEDVRKTMQGWKANYQYEFK